MAVVLDARQVWRYCSTAENQIPEGNVFSWILGIHDVDGEKGALPCAPTPHIVVGDQRSWTAWVWVNAVA